MQELQTRELGPEDYDFLLNLEQKQTMISLHKFLAMAYEKIYKPPAPYFSYPHCCCVFCEVEIFDRSTGLELK